MTRQGGQGSAVGGRYRVVKEIRMGGGYHKRGRGR